MGAERARSGNEAPETLLVGGSVRLLVRVGVVLGALLGLVGRATRFAGRATFLLGEAFLAAALRAAAAFAAMAFLCSAAFFKLAAMRAAPAFSAIAFLCSA
ncbi:MAG: hypothetical protein ACYCZM_10235, partial [Acidimicrobiales bacterium]